MWVIFHERNSIFTHVDKNVFAVVEDKDILQFQESMATMRGEMKYPLLEGQYDFLQNFVGLDFFAKQYEPMTRYTDSFDRVVQKKPEKVTASLFRDVEPQSLCNNGR